MVLTPMKGDVLHYCSRPLLDEGIPLSENVARHLHRRKKMLVMTWLDGLRFDARGCQSWYLSV